MLFYSLSEIGQSPFFLFIPQGRGKEIEGDCRLLSENRMEWNKRHNSDSSQSKAIRTFPNASDGATTTQWNGNTENNV
jgi:hypothetical protein